MNKFINTIKDKINNMYSKLEKSEEELKNHKDDEPELESLEKITFSIPVNLIYNETVIGTACLNVHMKSKSE